jgi:hypothetical protein
MEVYMRKRIKTNNWSTTQQNPAWKKKKNNLKQLSIRTTFYEQEFHVFHRKLCPSNIWRVLFTPNTPHEGQRHNIPDHGILVLPNRSFQQANNSLTLKGITHMTPKIEKTNDQRSLAIGQWRRRWFTVTLLHIKH